MKIKPNRLCVLGNLEFIRVPLGADRFPCVFEECDFISAGWLNFRRGYSLVTIHTLRALSHFGIILSQFTDARVSSALPRLPKLKMPEADVTV
jgi:hypothetical protein